MEQHLLYSVLEKGILAPSADNLQPWILELRDYSVILRLDAARLSSYCDAGLAAPYVSAGALIENVRVAAAQSGFDIKCSYFPDPAATLKVARIEFVRDPDIRTTHYPFLEKRHTNRRFYRFTSKIPESVYRAVAEDLVWDPRFSLHWIKRGEKGFGRLAALAGKADQMRFEIERLHRELMQVMRFTDQEAIETRDGLSLKSLDAGPMGESMFRRIRSWENLKKLNRLGMSLSFNFYARMQMYSSSAAGLITIAEKSPETWVKGGETMQHVWHELTRHGVALQPMEALPIFLINCEATGGENLSDRQRAELERMRETFYHLFGISPAEGPVLLFRAGRSRPAGARSLRRPLDSFITIASDNILSRNPAP